MPAEWMRRTKSSTSALHKFEEDIISAATEINKWNNHKSNNQQNANGKSFNILTLNTNVNMTIILFMVNQIKKKNRRKFIALSIVTWRESKREKKNVACRLARLELTYELGNHVTQLIKVHCNWMLVVLLFLSRSLFLIASFRIVTNHE